MKDIKKDVKLLCRICGNDQFKSLDSEFEDLVDAPDTTRLKCSDCGHIFTKAELIEDNNENINAAIEETKDELIDEFSKELKKSLKGFKNIKIKL